MATEGTSHNLPKSSQVKLHSPSLLGMFCLAVLWANMGSEPYPSYVVPEKEETEWPGAVFFARRLFP